MSAKIDIDLLKPTSVVICAKNEYQNLKKYLPIVLQQDFPEFEVIVIDDGSTDDSTSLLAQFEDEYPNLFSFRIQPSEKNHPGKKQALQYGISLAKYHQIVVTDADCYPVSKKWLAFMTIPLANKADVVLGVSPYTKQKGLRNSFFRMEVHFVALQYINFTLVGLPFMGVGRNMAYKKEVFETHDIKSHWDVASGDDDLFINEISNKYAVEVMTNPESYTFSDAPKNISSWFRQKLRHYSAGYRYSVMQKIWLGYYWFSSLLLYILLIFATVQLIRNQDINQFAMILLFTTAMIRWIVTFLSVNKLTKQNTNFEVPLMDFLYIVSVWLVSPISTLIKNKWE